MNSSRDLSSKPFGSHHHLPRKAEAGEETRLDLVSAIQARWLCRRAVLRAVTFVKCRLQFGKCFY